jgi:hypothetical protein
MKSLPVPKPPSILYIGVTYYNNWYLAQALRKMGWKADVLNYFGAGAELFTHGVDFYLKQFVDWDGQYPQERFEFLRDVLQRYSQEPETLPPADRLLVRFFFNRVGERIARLPQAELTVFVDAWLEYIHWGGEKPGERTAALRKVLELLLRPGGKEQTRGKKRLRSGSGTRFMGLGNSFIPHLVHRLDSALWKTRFMVDAGTRRHASGVLSRWGTRFLLKLLRYSTKKQPLLKNLLRLFLESTRKTHLEELSPLFDVLDEYDIVHFTGVKNIRYFFFFNMCLFGAMPIGWDVALLKKIGKKIVYSNTGCLDGVSPTSFNAWPGYEPVCDSCRFRHRPDVCSDERNLAWGKLRNSLCDYQCTVGGNRADYNDDPRVHEVPEFYCLDADLWYPELPIPDKYRLSFPAGTVKIYHAVGNFDLRTEPGSQKNIKCTHIYLPLIERLKAEGHPVEMIFAKDIPSSEVRFYQAQADIVVDMLTFGFFGSNVREAMMLGKPAVCYLRPVWLESMRREIPEYVDNLPVISATPATIYEVLVDLIIHPEKRIEIGKRGREFAIKWHSNEVAGRRFDRFYRELLSAR